MKCGPLSRKGRTRKMHDICEASFYTYRFAHRFRYQKSYMADVQIRSERIQGLPPDKNLRERMAPIDSSKPRRSGKFPEKGWQGHLRKVSENKTEGQSLSS